MCVTKELFIVCVISALCAYRTLQAHSVHRSCFNLIGVNMHIYTHIHPKSDYWGRERWKKISVLSLFQLLSGQTINDGPATIVLQSFSVFRLCFDAVYFQTRLDGMGGKNWINLIHKGRMAPESFGYSIKHLSFTLSLSLFVSTLPCFSSSFLTHFL